MNNAILPSLLFFSVCIGLAVAEWLRYQEQNDDFIYWPAAEQFSDEQFETANLELPRLDEIKSKIIWPEAKVMAFLEAKMLLASDFYQTLSKFEKIDFASTVAKKLMITNPHKSIDYLSQLPAFIRKSDRAQFIISLAHARNGAEDQAVTSYKTLLSQSPGHLSASINLAILLKRQKKCGQAIPLLHKAKKISASRKKAKINALLGHCQLTLNNNEAAYKSFATSIEYRPDHAVTWLALARTSELLQYTYQQIDLNYQRACALRSHYRCWIDYGQFQMHSLNFIDAEANLLKAHQLRPSHKETRQLLAWVLFENEKYNEARKHWQWLAGREENTASIAINQTMLTLLDQHARGKKITAIALMNLPEKSQLTNDSVKALNYACFNRFIRCSQQVLTTLNKQKMAAGETIDLYRLWHQLIAQYSKTKSSVFDKQLKLLLAKGAYSPNIEWLRSQYYYEKQDFLPALTAINNALETTPKMPNYLKHKVVVLIAIQQYREARSILKQLQKNALNEAYILDQLAIIAWQEKDWLAIRNNLSTRAKYRELNAEELYRLASAYYQLGKIEKAKATLSSALLLAPNHIQARWQLTQWLCQEQQWTACRSEATRLLSLTSSPEMTQKIATLLNIKGKL